MSFGAYIISFADNDPEKRKARFEVHNAQLDDWLAKTDINIHVVAMNYQPGDHHSDPRVIYHDTAPRKCSAARHEAFRLFYESDYDWGVIMDNDATLYSDVQHNSSYNLIKEMELDLGRYKGVDVFFPINPAKAPFTEKLKDDDHQKMHVFERNLDLKGSMVFLRNFRKEGKACPMPDPNYDWCEDGKLAIDVVMLGYSVMVCENIVLREQGLSSSSFATAEVDRKPDMKLANERIMNEVGAGLVMSKTSPHLLDRKVWLKNNWKAPQVRVVANKDGSPLLDSALFG